tara:strand:- start:46981 stop:47166 length:186 start_codon:yes stop_codon:yes gene_type:complete
MLKVTEFNEIMAAILNDETATTAMVQEAAKKLCDGNEEFYFDLVKGIKKIRRRKFATAKKL